MDQTVYTVRIHSSAIEVISNSLILLRCQNYDGGIGGEPGIEGHGGYAFCGLAAMEIMGKADLLDIPLLLVIIISYF
jgi:prenyltransferase beta subunit